MQVFQRFRRDSTRTSRSSTPNESDRESAGLRPPSRRLQVQRPAYCQHLGDRDSHGRSSSSVADLCSDQKSRHRAEATSSDPPAQMGLVDAAYGRCPLVALIPAFPPSPSNSRQAPESRQWRPVFADRRAYVGYLAIGYGLWRRRRKAVVIASEFVIDWRLRCGSIVRIKRPEEYGRALAWENIRDGREYGRCHSEHDP